MNKKFKKNRIYSFFNNHHNTFLNTWVTFSKLFTQFSTNFQLDTDVDFTFKMYVSNQVNFNLKLTAVPN